MCPIERSMEERHELAEHVGAKSELLSSGQTRFYNRVAWASIYLRRAGLMTSPKREPRRYTTGQVRKRTCVLTLSEVSVPDARDVVK
ncbi:MAG: winged helix-turn-helix domain-containing protein [Flavobacteriales bacterium]|nr:winged helix-turn-helix domain-containing protein [Flavobacteriales bacterium]